MVLKTAGDVADERNNIFSVEIKRWVTRILEEKLHAESRRLDKELRKLFIEVKELFNVPGLIGPTKFNEPENLYEHYSVFVKEVLKQIKQTERDVIDVETNLEKQSTMQTDAVNKTNEDVLKLRLKVLQEIHSSKGDSYGKIMDVKSELDKFRKVYD